MQSKEDIDSEGMDNKCNSSSNEEPLKRIQKLSTEVKRSNLQVNKSPTDNQTKLSSPEPEELLLDNDLNEREFSPRQDPNYMGTWTSRRKDI